MVDQSGGAIEGSRQSFARVGAIGDIALYAAVIGVPFGCLVLACTVAVPYAWGALLWLTIAATGFDRTTKVPASAGTADVVQDALPIAIALAAIWLLPSSVVVLATSDAAQIHQIALFCASASFLGQVGHPAAHELIHRPDRRLRAIGAILYTSWGFGHHVSAHRLVHHRCVGTPGDPNTARLGESFWAFLPRAWFGCFRAGWQCTRGQHAWRVGSVHISPYVVWVTGALSLVLASGIAAGVQGVAVLVALWAAVAAQILLSDYVQHYGLIRRHRLGGGYEPVRAHHSWQAPGDFTGIMMLRATRHAVHHLHPNRPFTDLNDDGDAPRLPYPIPIMAMLALWPPLWHRIMDHRVEKATTRCAATPPMRSEDGRQNSWVTGKAGHEPTVLRRDGPPDRKRTATPRDRSVTRAWPATQSLAPSDRPPRW